MSFQNIIGERTQKITDFQSQVLVNYNLLLNTVKTENKRISDSYDKVFNERSADGQKSKYMNQSGDMIWKIYGYLFWVYYITITILSILLYFQPFSIYLKILIIIIMYGFPFYIYPAEEWLYVMTDYIWHILLSQVYSNGF
jgi:hypothetical protein